MVIALDAMGGDHFPHVPVEAACQALREWNDLHVALFGPEESLRSELKRLDASDIMDRILIEHSAEVIEMTDSPGKVVRSKPDASLLRAIDMHQSGAAQAVVSAGHTGVQMAASYMKLGLIKGVRRPTIGGLFPKGDGKFAILLDVGANTDCKPINLLQFAVMGSVYMELLTGTKNPRIALISIGEERTKGNELVLATHYLLEQSGLNFVGNVEGRDLLSDKADVMVCDGFVGNVILKLSESLFHAFMSRVAVSDGNGPTPAVLGKMAKEFDYSEIGGVPLLGVNGVSIICHGGSPAKAIKNAIGEARRLVQKNLPSALSEGVDQYDASMLARGMAMYKGRKEKRDELEVEETDDE
ncbi:MAG: phosphate acyltransferase PlsX [Calditrichaeota bacterium]|nr:phosphate acyltransferase PlsX [Calditrichota bacterium]MCB9366485.1 phosphate acyltransferase PlsX [Calditrichota bacterium]MCB9391257.1 phosphate acyltransferase PlsX [Calditrichota bacterium]